MRVTSLHASTFQDEFDFAGTLVGAGAHEGERRQPIGELGARAEQSIAQEASLVEARAIEPTRHRGAQRPVGVESMVVAKVDATKLSAEEGERLGGGPLAEVIGGAEGEGSGGRSG